MSLVISLFWGKEKSFGMVLMAILYLHVINKITPTYNFKKLLKLMNKIIMINIFIYYKLLNKMIVIWKEIFIYFIGAYVYLK